MHTIYEDLLLLIHSRCVFRKREIKALQEIEENEHVSMPLSLIVHIIYLWKYDFVTACIVLVIVNDTTVKMSTNVMSVRYRYYKIVNYLNI